MEIRRICVFCGSNSGKDPVYRQAAVALGKTIVRRELDLVYGGGSVGLMGILADTVLEAGGSVTGIIPRALERREVAHEQLTAIHVVDDMHTRKAKMEELADAFVAMPGGYGTLEELFEVVTWAQLGLHRKPVGMLNPAGYFDGLLDCIDSAVVEGFIKPEHRRLLVVGAEPDALLDALARHEPPEVEKWIREGET
ncbi:MAG: LOG family protein [Planctomycetota bacterium]